MTERPEPELRAVVAHELSHIVHRDAVVITLLATPSVYVLRTVRAFASDDPFRAPFLIAAGFYFIGPALVLGLLGRIVSRQRELAADRSAALLTGSPAALASALVRSARTGNQFHVLPVQRRDPGPVREIWATHSPLENRLEQLHEMERNCSGRAGPARSFSTPGQDRLGGLSREPLQRPAA